MAVAWPLHVSAVAVTTSRLCGLVSARALAMASAELRRDLHAAEVPVFPPRVIMAIGCEGSLSCFDPCADGWCPARPLSPLRDNECVVVHHGLLWGLDVSPEGFRFRRLDAQACQWRELPPPPLPVLGGQRHFTMEGLDDHIYICEMFPNETTGTQVVARFDVHESCWERLPFLREPVEEALLFTVAESVVVVSGSL